MNMDAAAFRIRPATRADSAAAYDICLKTGDYGKDGTRFYREDPDALGRIYVGPYLAFEPEHAFLLETQEGVCGYALGALDSKRFHDRYEKEWRPRLSADFPEPSGPQGRWTRTQQAHYSYHHPDYFCPEPYNQFPSHLHVDLLPMAQGKGWGRKLVRTVMESLKGRGSPGVHLCMSAHNEKAFGFYERLGFKELCRAGSGPDACIYMAIRLK